MLKLKQQDITDLLYGCAVLGTGGGGSLEKGRLLRTCLLYTSRCV